MRLLVECSLLRSGGITIYAIKQTLLYANKRLWKASDVYETDLCRAADENLFNQIIKNKKRELHAAYCHRLLLHRITIMSNVVYGHFRPKTLRTQDISAHVFGAEVSQIFALVPKCPVSIGHFGTSAEMSNGHFGTKVHETLRTQN